MSGIADISNGKSSTVAALITASSTGLAGAITTVLIYIPQYFGLKPLPEQMDEAILTIISALVAYVAHKKTSN